MRVAVSLLLLVTAVSLTAFAPVPPYRPKPDPSKEDLQKLQGEWVRVSCVIEGVVRPQQPGAVVVKVQGDLMAFGSPGDTWMITLDAGKKPKQLDSRNTTRKGKGWTFLGVYRLEGDTFVICWRRDDSAGGRPSGFDPAEPEVWLHTYQRKKP